MTKETPAKAAQVVCNMSIKPATLLFTLDTRLSKVMSVAAAPPFTTATSTS